MSLANENIEKRVSDASAARFVLLVGIGLGAVVLLDSMRAAWQGWKPFASRLDFAVIVLATTVCLVSLILLSNSRSRMMIGRYWRQIASAGIAVIGTIAVAELGLALIGDRLEAAPFHGHPRGLVQELTPTLPGVSSTARFTVNSLGLRGPELPIDEKVVRVLCIGGSTTEDFYIDDSKTWTRLLASEIEARDARRYWTASAGKSGYASAEHLQFLETSPILEQIDVAVVLLGINDLARAVWGKDADRVAEKARPFWSHSRILALLKRLRAQIDPRNLVMDRDALFVLDAQTRRHQAKVMEGEISIDPYLTGYYGRLRAMVEAARRRGVSLVLVTQPTAFRADMTPEEEKRLWFLRRAEGDYLPPRRMRELMDRYNQVTRKIAHEFGVPVVDLTPMDGRTEFFYDDCHFTEVGAAEVARRVAEGVDWARFPVRRVRDKNQS